MQFGGSWGVIGRKQQKGLALNEVCGGEQEDPVLTWSRVERLSSSRLRGNGPN